MRTEATQIDTEPAGAPAKDFSALVRSGCQDYVLRGIGLPIAAYVFHAVKLGLLVLGWMYFCSFTPGLGSPQHIGSWWFAGIAFQKAVIWACLVEALEFGCMSGPLGSRIWPPFTTFPHLLRPGTTKLAPSPALPLFGGTTRSRLDVALFAAALLRAQEQCHFEEGELRAIMVESQPLLGSSLRWRIVDAKRGLLDEGHVPLAELARRAPWDYGER